MQKLYDPQARIFSRLTYVLALLLALGVPLNKWLEAYSELGDTLRLESQVKASVLNGLVANLPETWMFAENRIQGLIAHEPVAPDNAWIEVLEVDGSVISTAGRPQLAPMLHRATPLFDAGKVVGQVVVSRSLRPSIKDTLEFALLSIPFAGLLLLILRWGPLRALQRVSDELLMQKERAEVTLSSIGDAVITTDAQQRIIFVNPAAEKMIGKSQKDVMGRDVADVIKIVDSETGLPIASTLQIAMQTHSTVSCEGQSLLQNAKGDYAAVEEQAVPTFDRQGILSGGVLCLRDVSEEREYLRIRSWEASHDQLTGLANRRDFEKRVGLALANAQDGTQRYVLCYLDLDRFKVVNDSCGHAAGDALLVQLAGVMQACVRETDRLARLGGDEFGLLLEGCDIAHGEMIANDVQAAVSAYQFSWDSNVFTVGASIGLTSITQENFSVAALLHEADAACYWAKEQGRNRVCAYVASDADLAARRSQTSWVARITAALKENRFVLYHQIYLGLSEAVGGHRHLEVLLRMVDERGEIVEPGFFLPAAERYNLIPEIDRWVIHEVFSEFPQIRVRHPDASLMVCINLSGSSINSPHLLEYVRDQLAQYEIDPGSICFEVTETATVKNLQAAVEFMHACKALGIKFALDDFGTGTSSFNYLKNLPVDYLKIDGTFVKNMQHDPVDRAMTESINRIGHIMGKLTVAEFAEDEATIEILRKMGVDFAQGYAVCKPRPLFLLDAPE